MGRIVKEVVIGGVARNALFDTGANRSYIVRRAVPKRTERHPVKPAIRVGMGGQHHRLSRVCLVEGTIEGLPVSLKAYPVTEIGHADGKELDLLIGAPVMEEYEIRLDPAKSTLDLTALRRREFVDF